MDNKIIFVRTSKGEDETHSRTSHLGGDVKRALLMVDGSATFGEISKRAAPSMRASLGEMFEELEKGGFIQAKPMAVKSAKAVVPPKIVTPTKMATPKKPQPADGNAGELDFMSGFAASKPEAPTPGTARTGKSSGDAETKSKQETEAEKLRAKREAEAILLKAEQEAARIRQETARRARDEAESTRLKAEQEASKVREELEAARLKAEEEARVRLEAAAKERQRAEAERLRAEQEARKLREEIEAARLKAEEEARLRLEAAAKERQRAEAERLRAEQEARKLREEIEAARLKAEEEARLRLEAAVKERQQAEAARAKAEQDAAQEARKLREELEAARLKAEEEAKQQLEAAAEERKQAEAERLRAEREARKLREELEAAKAREAVDLLARQERDAAQSQIADEAQAELISEVIAANSDEFAFDAFHIDEPQRLAEPHGDQQPAQKAGLAQQPGDAAKANRSEDIQRPVGQQVTTPVASQSTEGHPSQEQIENAVQERKAVDERMAVEAAEAKKMAEAQAKIWAEAEQRAIEAARAEAEQAAKQAAFSIADVPSAKPVAVARVRRKPFSWGSLFGFAFKLGLFLLVLFIGALFIIPYAVPMRDYMPKAEQLLSARLHQPVHIGRFSGRILPTPRLELGEIYIGDAKQFQADDAQINFALTGLFTEAKPISSVEFQGVIVRGAWIRNVSEWLQQMANESRYPVSRIVISEGKMDADVFEVTGIEGELDFDSAGKFTETNLHANAGKYALVIKAAPEGRLKVALTLRDSALPLLPNWTFDELSAKGELNGTELAISDFDAKMLGGVVQGDATINWRSGWRAQGTLSAKSIPMQKLSKLLDGNVEGAARFKMTSIDLAGLTDSVMVDGTFTAKDGMISGMDIVETARMRSKENLPGGRTHFDELKGAISYANNAYHFKQVKVAAGVLDATATFDVNKQQLTGKMNVNLSMHDVTAPADLQMGGSIDNPTLRFSP